MTGDIEKTGDGVLVIRRINVRYQLRLEPQADRSKVERVHGFHAEKCPVARSIRDAIDISTDLGIVEEPQDGADPSG